MKGRNHEAPTPDEKLPKASKSIESEKHYLTTVKMDTHSPVQDFLCRDEHQQLFETLWKKKRMA